MYFPSKKDTWVTILFLALAIIMGAGMFESGSVVVYVIGIATIILLGWMWFGTGYHIEAGRLKIKAGPLRSTVKIENIRGLKASHTFLSGPALSMDRIEIQYNKYDIAIVSPKDKAAFVHAVVTENNSIKVDDKLLT